MNEDDRRQFESLDALQRATYKSFDDRRTYEWKLALALWAAEAIVLASLLRPIPAGESFPIEEPWSWIGALVIGLLLTLLHAYWSAGASKANAIDKDAAIEYLEAMRKLVKVQYGHALKALITAWQKKKSRRSWSHAAQVGITLLLAFAIAVAIAAKG